MRHRFLTAVVVVVSGSIALTLPAMSKSSGANHSSGATTKSATVQAKTKTTKTNGTGKAQFEPFTATKQINSASPK